jgi:hypothetical protein
MIEILQEVTDWSKAGHTVSNGIYHVSPEGYLVQHNDTVFKNPLKGFSKSRRKFVKVGERNDIYRPDVRRVEGSNGKIYIITDGKCSCPGFMYRGDCKHARNS